MYGLTIGEAGYVSVCMRFFSLKVDLRFLWHALFLEHALWYGLIMCQVAHAMVFPSC